MSTSTTVDHEDGYSENTCVVCFKTVDIFSIGICDHPVCYECSTRMRVLCRQNECPICRHDMQKVIFTKVVQPFKILDESIGAKHLIDRKFKIVFENTEVQHAYNTLLAHVCSKCSGRRAFQTFNNLRDHMRKEHELFYCDLCIDNLKILTHERRCYTRKELATHRRQGDQDNRSHRGHPLCEFCDRRYMDNDELYRHLRRDHLYCHFCDADGLHQYYDSYDVLRNHFKAQHFLCEEGDCYEEKFTPAFRTEIDLKAHRASAHGRQMTKAAAKQARTLELAFTLKPRPRQAEQRRGGPRYNNSYSDEEEGAVGGVVSHYHTAQQQPTPTFSKLDMASNDQFPSLGGSGGIPGPATLQGLHFRKPGRAVGALTIREEDFPALGPEATVSLRVNSVSTADRIKGPSNVSIHVNHRPNALITTVSSTKNTQPDRDPFPALQNSSASSSGKASNTVPPASALWSARIESEPKLVTKKKPNQPAIKQTQPKNSKLYQSDDDSFARHNDFPALNGNIPSHIASLASTQWSLGKEPEPKLTVNKNKVTQPPPKPPQPKTFHIEDDFPSLSSRFDAGCSFSSENRSQVCSDSKPKKESSISISVENNWTRPVSDNISSDSDIGNKKSTKKKKNKSKTQKDQANEPVKPPNKNINNNNETGKKNKQKDVSKSNPKQARVDGKEKQPLAGHVQESLQTKKSAETLARKRSELMIESLNSEENVNEFPNLESGKSNSTSQTPPGFTNVAKEKSSFAAPPGFENKSKPPPGFSITLNSVARAKSNGLTFTSSSGHNYPISPGDKKESTRVFTYVAPPNVKQRNSSLVERVRAALSSVPALNEFLQMSALFRQGSLSADAYYTHCHQAIGPDSFSHIFPELLVLLPDIDKQQELWNVADKSLWKLNECAVCGQIMAAADFKHHHNTHSLENHFPSLPNGLSESNVWTKK